MGPMASILLAYGAGCVSFAGLVSRLKGVDVRAHGSGNPGATNVGRILGKRWGRFVLLLDMAKGYVPVLLLTAPPGELLSGQAPAPWMVDPQGHSLIALAAVLGHIYPVTSGFRGGKGVATFVGAALALDPVLAVVSVGTHVVFKKALGFVSLASVALAWAFPLGQLVAAQLGPWGRFVDGRLVLVAVAVLITVRHRENFLRIREGREDRYDARGPAADKD